MSVAPQIAVDTPAGDGEFKAPAPPTVRVLFVRGSYNSAFIENYFGFYVVHILSVLGI